MPFIEGFFIGLSTVIFVGPVFFLLLNSSIQNGYKAGFAVATGIIVSDLVYVILCYLGISALVGTTVHQFWIGILGGCMVLGLGVYYLVKKKFARQQKTSVKSVLGFFLKGFSINFFNPFVLAVWIGIYQWGQVKYDLSSSFWMYLTAVLLGIFCTDSIKVIFSKKLGYFLSETRLLLLSRIIGLLLICFSLRLFYSVL
ncbi:LysE family translocator [Aquimarina brevivitae]|uniref:Threonine/homoserine/homoserine lactone efflux protein n=1 Tax=Aquimarina brevivitae TaxID=323412 RepID=A0A4Q7NYS7_9FLAO|nr:LysE family transporter [Aquimarina brevivitae]RZS92444.1 threonine/homoserine/homoserine lactone efflux protein [Aquimarina brevivitae]